MIVPLMRILSMDLKWYKIWIKKYLFKKNKLIKISNNSLFNLKTTHTFHLKQMNSTF